MTNVARIFVAIFIASIPLQTLAAPLATPAPIAPAAGSGQGLEISPPVIDNLKADPGQTVTANIRLRNVTKGELSVTGQADDFGAKGEAGEPQILLDEKEETRYSLKFWINQVPSFRLVPQEVKTAQIKIVVPANAEPGGHYGVIRFTGLPPELEGTGVSLSASIGALVLLRVTGDIVEKLSLEEFYAYAGPKLCDTSKGVCNSDDQAKQGAIKKAKFFEQGPINLVERIRNEGSVHEKPTGSIKVFNMFGKQIANMPLSKPARNVLPDSIRKFDQTLDRVWLFGPYRAELVASYASGKTLNGQLVFWVIPWKLLLLLVAVVTMLYFGIRHGIRRYNKRIIERSRRN